MSSDIVVKDRKQLFISLFSGVLVSVATTLILILLFAVIIRFFNLSESWIFPVNQVIKCISLFIGISVMLKKIKSKGFLNGILFGIVYYVLSTIVFSILQAKFSFGLNNLYDLLLTSLIGGIIGIFVINFKKNSWFVWL